jgi:hypothetical protein
MARTVLIVGGLPTPCVAADVLAQLSQRSAGVGVIWEWAQTDGPEDSLLPNALVNKVLYLLPNETKDVIIVKLRRLYHLDKEKLKERKPLLNVPGTVTTGEQLIAWLLDPARGLVHTSV